MDKMSLTKLNNKGFTQIENILAVALFAILVLELSLTVGRMHQNQTSYKSLVTASQIAETIAGEISVVGLGYDWFKTGMTHERYFDPHGNETSKASSKFTVRWTVTPDIPIAGMKMANFKLFWTEGNKDRDLSFRVAR